MDVAAGLDRSLDRVVRWEGFHNARDLGGLPTVTGASTRYGQLIRSADTRFITAAGWDAARAAGIRFVIDLRNADEVVIGSVPAATLGAGTFAVPAARSTAARPTDIQIALMPLDDIEDVGLWRRLNGAGLTGTPPYYRPFLDAKPERIAAVLTAIARARDGGVIFHWRAGRDRTGLISLLLLALADVTPEASSTWPNTWLAPEYRTPTSTPCAGACDDCFAERCRSRDREPCTRVETAPTSRGRRGLIVRNLIVRLRSFCVTLGV